MIVSILVATDDGMQVDTNDAGKEQEKSSAVEYNDQPPSDDDDFPDEKEIFQANGLLKLQKTISGPVSKTNCQSNVDWLFVF